MRFRVFLLFLLLGCWVLAAAGQKPQPRKSGSTEQSAARKPRIEKPTRGSLSGRVLSDAGQPMAEISVMAIQSGAQDANNAIGFMNVRSALTDAAGNFSLDDLRPGAYKMNVFAPGYVLSDFDEGKYFRPGDHVTLRLVKGGVITGTVTDSSGAPVIGIQVKATMVRDAQGGRPPLRPFNESDILAWGRTTDDRGIYRLFGLEPGAYLVSAGSAGVAGPWSREHYDGAPSYYPSGPRGSAEEVIVTVGAEAAGIDIRYREDPGHAISGAVIGAQAKPASQFDASAVALTEVSSGALQDVTTLRVTEGAQSFTFKGVIDGEYELVGVSGFGSDGLLAGASRRVAVKGADVTGVDIVLRALGTITGRVVLQKPVATGVKGDCPKASGALIQESLVIGRRESRDSAYLSPVARLMSLGLESAPNEEGEFSLRALEPGRYRLEMKLSSEDWYVREISLPASGKGTTSVDPGRNGLVVKSGETLKGLTITLGEGAASFRGRVIPDTERASLPPRLEVHLAPAAPELSDDVLRFAECAVQSDGSFELTNLAPGRYWILVREARENDGTTQQLLAWGSVSRARLRRDAETGGVVIDLKPCERLVNFVVRHSPTSGPTPRK